MDILMGIDLQVLAAIILLWLLSLYFSSIKIIKLRFDRKF